tara:strand:- start:280 stop:513 length:234 start_codon:yes stop_codon:yes gene_type:complete
MKILRICRQSWGETVFEDKEDLRTSLIDLHMDEVTADEEFTPKMLQQHKSSTLDELCNMFDWDYEEITDEKALKYND